MRASVPIHLINSLGTLTLLVILAGPVFAAGPLGSGNDLSADQAEKELKRAVMQRLTDQGRNNEAQTLDAILVRSRSHADSWCALARTFAQAMGKPTTGFQNGECSATLRLETAVLMAGFGDLSIGIAYDANRVHYCEDKGPGAECRDPSPGFEEETRQKDRDTREGIAQGKGIVADLSEEERQAILTAFDRSQSDLDALEKEECSFALSLRSDSPPEWAVSSCEAQQRSSLRWGLGIAVKWGWTEAAVGGS